MNGDIELEIGAGSEAGNYMVRVVRAAAGGEPAGALKLDVDEMLSRRDLLEATILASAVSRRSVPVAEQPVREIGRQLFQALFTGPVYGMYRASLGVAQQSGKRLRVVLRLTAPELAALPWETLFDPETSTYLCRQEPLVRHVPAPYTSDPLEVRPPLRILGLIASPRGLPPLDVDTEKDRLAEALAEPVAEGLIEVVWVPQATWQSVHARLLAGQWHVLHFVGHGDYNTDTDEGVLALVGGDGRADLVEAGRLADLLGEAQPIPRLVMLNSCSSGETGANDLFSGTAAALVRSGISAVAAMQFSVSDTAAIAFARGFYTAIAHGRGVDEAARSGRISILGAPRSLEWVTPVLYVRGQATHLFTLIAPPVEGREPRPDHHVIPGDQSPTPEKFTELARRRQAELRALYVEAHAELRLEHFDTAIGLLDDLLTLDPDHPGTADLRDKALRDRQLADAYAAAAAEEDAGHWVAAAHGYDEILQTDPAYRDAAARKSACEARQRVAALQAELCSHADAGQRQDALDVDAELSRLDPSASDPDGLATRAAYQLGELCQREGRPEEAKAWYERAAPGHLDAAYKLGELYQRERQPAEAEARFENAANRGHVYAAYQLGMLLWKTEGDRAGAENWLRKADQGGERKATYELGELLWEIDKPAEAKAWFENAANRGHVYAAYQLGMLLWKTEGDRAGAENWLRKAEQGGESKATSALYELKRAPDEPDENTAVGP